MTTVILPFGPGAQTASITADGVTESVAWTNEGGVVTPPPDEPTENPTITRTQDYTPDTLSLSERKNPGPTLWNSVKSQKKFAKYDHASGIKSVSRRIFNNGTERDSFYWGYADVGDITFQDIVTTNDGTVEVFASETVITVAAATNPGAFVSGDIVLTQVPSILGNELRCDIQAWPADSGTSAISHAEYSCDGGAKWTRLARFGKVGRRPLVLPNSWNGGGILFRMVNQEGAAGPVFTYSNAPAGVVGDPVVHVSLVGTKGRAPRTVIPAPAVFYVEVYPEGFGEINWQHTLYPTIHFGDSDPTFRNFPPTFLWGNDHNTMRSCWVGAHAYRSIGTYTITATVVHPLHPDKETSGTVSVEALDPLAHFDNIHVVDPDGDFSGFPASRTGEHLTLTAASEAVRDLTDVLILCRGGKTHTGRYYIPTRGDLYLLSFGTEKFMVGQEEGNVEPIVGFHHDAEGIRMLSGMKYVGRYRADFDPALGYPHEPANALVPYGRDCEGSHMHDCDLGGFSKGVYWYNYIGLAGVFDTIMRGGHDFPAFAGDADQWAFVGCQFHQQPLAWLSGDGEPKDWPGNPHARHDAVRASRLQDFCIFHKCSIFSIGNWSSRTLPQPDVRIGRGGERASRTYVSECVFQGGGPNLMYNIDAEHEHPGVDVLVDSALIIPTSSPFQLLQIRMGHSTYRNVDLVISDVPKQSGSSVRDFLSIFSPKMIFSDFELPVNLYNVNLVDLRRGSNRDGKSFSVIESVEDQNGRYHIPNLTITNYAIIGPEIPNVSADTGFDLDLEEFFPEYIGRRQAIPLDDTRLNYSYQELETEFALKPISLFTPEAGSSVVGDADTSDHRLVAYWDKWGTVHGANPPRGSTAVGSTAPGLA